MRASCVILGMRIVAGNLLPGQRLPAKPPVLADYEVSARCLREARRRCSFAKGLVLSRQRAGAIVRPRNEWHLLDSRRAVTR